MFLQLFTALYGKQVNGPYHGHSHSSSCNLRKASKQIHAKSHPKQTETKAEAIIAEE